MTNPNPIAPVENVLKEAAKDAATVAAIVAPVLATLAAVLPGVNLPVQDVAILTAASSAVTGFVSWAKQHGLIAKFVGR